ncbi:MAG TPA: UDP-N-acetylmuramoyl-tripeptide--D-alanyl-D-alanine ligase [Blastocatellia bacterium]|nr:UDP-N-acetylmuramoyl-tripeptide--D-alanyl-D-alanine ligase [Blastocatellia bacterium]
MKLDRIIKTIESSASIGAAMIDREPAGYSIDSRTIRAGEIFFAVRGEVHDGHRFVESALEKGAMAAVVSRDFAASNVLLESRLIPVEEPLAALKRLATTLLEGWQQGRVIAITGSMGKTTTKEMTAAALARIGRVMKTTGNLNNEYGLPLSILKMETDGAHVSDFDFAVLEMGMNHRGELRQLTRIARPDLSVVTNVAPVHLEFFSSVDEIAEAKSELVEGVKPGGAAVLNADDPRVARMRDKRDNIEFRFFGIDLPADVSARDIESEGLGGTRFTLITPRGLADVRLRLAGRHNIYNALAAATAADFYGAMPEAIAASLSESSSPSMRGEVLQFEEGFTIVDDSYNSNPRALVEMVRTIAANRDFERKIVVAGEMLELGPEGATLHRETGERIAASGINLLIGVRGLASEMVDAARRSGMSEDAAIFCESPEEAAKALAREARRGDLILVKGSRGVRTEIVVNRIKQGSGVRGQGSGIEG